MKRTLWFSLMTIVVVALAGCSDDDIAAPGNQNQPPTASITASPTALPEGDDNSTIVTLDGSASSDPDGDQLSFAWTVPNGTFVNGTTASDPVIQVTFPGTAPSTVTLEVDDGRGVTATAEFTVGLITNRAPSASISASPTALPEGDYNSTFVTLDGSASSDPDGDQLSFAWTVPNGTFVNGTTDSDPVIQVTFPGAAPNTVTLVVEDGMGGTASAQFTIGIIAPANNAPTASISADPTEVPQGDNNSTVVTLDGSASSDPDEDQLSFAWTVPNGTFVNGTTASDPVIQVTFPGAHPYTVTLVVDDGRGGTDSAQVTIGLSN